MNAYDEYMKGIVGPMRSELTGAGFKELITPEDVQEHMSTASGVSLIVINSVCGCAAGLARPAVVNALNELEVKPENLVTVFAGQDQEATATMRGYFEEVPPSSPSIAIWKDDQLAYFIPREQIESNSMETIKDHLSGVLSQVVSS
ncbi:putative bacilliredoxin, YphP/YqiW family [Paenisporosarcina quisquiliarum]|uniref:BrxA/BrxB family bacilliredoxin n=1 Tax=Psychrobacillus TaxID=1221880 RepID=UPI0008BF12C4|nr:BrxA/BrxB family bacilliredoxin [Psychrobacillus psychrodurans]MCK1998794.1 BrxA/BrxB family bacilliredoxin [Psychrobacillus psychrodurans]MCZ8539952.1 BrxA/BrxB family bacilliredoxin [Psychrobacillus psychrodurans]SEM03585.1 putative bacilliredoxin, YphP/YqiW family [Paenisporosarcina quisquiliarum]SFM53567.1 putative bacilliredoxin, YphP/YqiW family [Psychrobacillus psychrodurans]